MAFAPRSPATAESLLVDLAAARTACLPFFKDFSPSLDIERVSFGLKQADWRLDSVADWSQVALPHYGGPIGKARTWYRMKFPLEACHLDTETLWLCFGGVDYKAAVFLNGAFIGTHEGFFSPFEFEITGDSRVGENELLVRVDNDAICHSNNSWDDPRSGDKIYGATGLGWDEPGIGWHHCPPGMGIHRPVRIEVRPKLYVKDLFARPLPDEEVVEIHVEIFNGGESEQAFHLDLEVHSQNFAATSHCLTSDDLPPAGAGFNRYRIRVPLADARLWTPDKPWLYQARAILNAGSQPDALSRQFGMRTFVIDESPGADGRRGRFLLNGQPIRLRGANTMGHEQQCVLKGDLEQLCDDLLLAKLANMNFLRFTQRPVETEVYEMCDRLGIMAQTDLPLFAYLRRNQFCEAVRQASEMERLIRGHACCVLTSLINEPFPAAWGDFSHRHLTRAELENFFVAASHAIHVENPDRQIKPIDGDYEPPGPGLPDGHCYSGWYNGHGLELGKLHKGHWMQVKPGWNYACGEFGAEGLDDEDLMRTLYPAAWLPTGPDDETAWTPSRIQRSQTGTHHYLWIKEGGQMSDWIRRSQEHQAWITRLMTEAFRRDNRMVSFAIHLFIDAWPAGWMKTIMDCRRHPKPAYFAYREALAPLAASLRMDRTAGFAGEMLEAEVWVCNDRNEIPRDAQLAYQIERGGTVISSGGHPARIRPCEAIFQGRIRFELPQVSERETLTLRLGIISNDKLTLHDTSIALQVFSQVNHHGGNLAPRVLGGAKARQLAEELGPVAGEMWIIDDPAKVNDPELLAAVRAGATALLIEFPPGECEIAGSTVRFESCGMEPRHFVARAKHHLLGEVFQENDFRFWFDPELDRPSPLLHTLFFADDSWIPIHRTGQGGWGQAWEPALATAEMAHLKGRFILCQITLAGRLVNPVARLFASHIGGRRDRI